MRIADVKELLDDLAEGWRSRDYARVASRFTLDVVYADPLRYRLEGREALRAFFEDDEGRAQHVAWHAIAFDESSQSGSAEYTYEGTSRYHGVALFALRGDRIASWREYQHVDARPFDAFAVAPAARPAGEASASEREVAEREIRAMVDRETAAWNAKDAAALAALFHPDMVWPWPPDAGAHDPAEWVMFLGRFDRRRWIASWQSLFDGAELVHNDRRIATITLSREGDGALAVVDIDTAWRGADGTIDRWQGRVGKVYARLADGTWRITMHTGVLDYGRVRAVRGSAEPG